MKQLSKHFFSVITMIYICLSSNSFSQVNNSNTNKALIKAVKEGRTTTVMALIGAGADVNVSIDGSFEVAIF